ncbi:unnamed protein product [Rotaria sp. Silwood1]|nr:unnamed protein product [Rotaria sp. Silwood1]CAF1459780.1 unnamed protein product [Rotaria sp. Silwood1]CAF1468357.1 unnamed protein product [Rotaria sp. Silwood1]CAF3611607.1 unnamed protein product [Rotaria sp. Silwood1]CAF4756245.1 unnamed protein product [Rotaria sp. Silwood1]
MKPTLKINFLSSNHTSMLTTLHQQQKHCIVYLKVRSGRLGNRMFMIASAYGLARLHSCHLYITPEIINEVHALFILDLSPFLISTIMFNSIIHNTLKPMTTIRKHAGCQYVRELTRPNAISPGHILELHGYWQSYLHFAKYSDDIRQRIFVARQPVLEKVSKLFIKIYEQKFHFKPQFSLENHQLFKKQLTQSNWTTWVGIHIRRKDFVPLNFSSSDQYLFAAIDYYTSHYSNVHFIVASDDKSYCKNLFRHWSNITVTPQSFSIGDDLIALSLCEHSIITGGTFGWWTGYLANGEVIHDKLYPSGCERREYYYPPWFLIDGDVRAHKNGNYTL